MTFHEKLGISLTIPTDELTNSIIFQRARNSTTIQSWQIDGFLAKSPWRQVDADHVLRCSHLRRRSGAAGRDKEERNRGEIHAGNHGERALDVGIKPI